MSGGGAPDWDRFAHWPRGWARAALAVLVGALLWAVATATAQSTSGAVPLASGPMLAENRPAQRDTDLQLYDRIASRVTHGDEYHHAAVEEQRAANFPVSPALAVRLPAMAYLTALMGGELLGVLSLLAVATAAVWFFAGDQPGWLSHRLPGVALLIVGMSAGWNPAYASLHEVWAGLLIALAIGLHRPGKWHWAWLAAAAALAIRELALPFVLLLGALAIWRRDWREAGAWALLVALFAAYLAWHLAEVNALLLPSDRDSPSWLALRGMRGLTQNIAETTALQFLPRWLAAPLALVPLVGWAGWKSPLGLLATLFCAGYGLFFMIAGRDNNFYWALLVVPVWFAGLAFAPMALGSLWRSARTA